MTGAGGSAFFVVLASLLLAPLPAGASLRMSVAPMKVHLSTEPGGSVACAVNVYNNGDDAVRVVTAVRDWCATEEGGINLSPTQPLARSATSFVRPEVAEFTIGAHASRVVRVLASLPDSALGSYWTMVFFECDGATRSSGLGVATKLCLGTTVYLTARGTEQRADRLTAMAVNAGEAKGSLSLDFSLANDGNVYHYPNGWVQVAELPEPAGDARDSSAGGPASNGPPLALRTLFEEKVSLRVLLPGARTTYRTAWVPPGAGLYRFVVTLDLGLESLVQGVKEFRVPPTTEIATFPPLDPVPSPRGQEKRAP